MKCPNCKKTVDGNFCTYCGTPLSSVPSTTEPKKGFGFGSLFGKKEIAVCSICNQNESSKVLSDGFICKECMSKCSPFINTAFLNWKAISSERVKQALSSYDLNNQRNLLFNKTRDAGNYLEIDESNRFWRTSHAHNVVFSFDDIIDFELLVNGESFTKGGLGSAVVGGALFGGVGAIVGGAVGKKKTIQEISEYRIKVSTSHPFFPVVYINLLTCGKVKEDSFIHKANVELAHKILSLLSQIMNSNETPTVSSSCADEILKFKNLADNGIITEEEFLQKKKQLLGL